jgi:hypothetical protein
VPAILRTHGKNLPLGATDADESDTNPHRPMAKAHSTIDDHLQTACAEFWQTYHSSMAELHARQGRTLTQPIKDRNLGTTDAKHIRAFEQFWCGQLAAALGVSPTEVGPRKIAFRPYRSKKFDVCWPLTGEPKILISIKSMQNAYRNFTNRIEEAFGDSAVLRLYRVPAAFGFFFFMLDGNVPRGLAEQGKAGPGHAISGKGKGIAPFLEVIEEGGDFFQLSNVAEYRKEAVGKSRGRQDVLGQAEQSLLDLYTPDPTPEGGIHYDSIAFVPTRVKRLKPTPTKASHWSFAFSPVDERLDFHPFVNRLVEVARFRKLI